MSYENISMTNEDAQYLDTRQFQRNEICALFRVPPHMVGDLTKSSFSNITQQSLEFVKYSVLPWCRRIETAFWHGLLSDEQRREGFRIEFLVDGLERADIKTRYESYSIAIQNGMLSPNECRRLENRNPRDGGDVFLQPLNMTDGTKNSVEGGEGSEELKASARSAAHQGPSSGGTPGEAGWGSAPLAANAKGDSWQCPAGSEPSALPQSACADSPLWEGALECGASRRETKAAAEDEDDEPEHDDWASGEWNEESADLNQIMRDFRPKLERMYREIVAREVAEIRKLVDRHFPEGEKRVKSAETEFLDALRILYEKLTPDMTADHKRVLYTELIGPITAMTARQCGVSSRKLLAELEKTVPDYAKYESERLVERAEGQLRALLREDGDLRDILNRRLDEWNDNRVRKLSRHAAVCTANWYARESYRASGVKYLRWVTNGAKTCGFCARLHGKVVGINKVFAGKGETFHSDGKPDLVTKRKIKHPPIHRGCVCAIVPVIGIAGVKQGEPMDFDAANKGRCNPYFGWEESDKPYRTNCQTTVVAYELRRRGYNVEALGNFDNASIARLAENPSLAWLVPGTDRSPGRILGSGGCQRHDDVLNLLKDNMQEGRRYVFNYAYVKKNIIDEATGKPRDVLGAHIVHAYRDKGKICLYDPQTTWKFQGKNAILAFLKAQKVEYNYPTETPGLLRVDNLEVNVTLVEKILRGATR